MKLVHVGIISTSLVIAIGVSLVAPALILPHMPQVHPVFLSFAITDSYNLPYWCNDLSDVLKKFDAKATVFISGNLAEKYPDCVTVFGKNAQIGSMTYNYVSLPNSDYLLQLDEVQHGKQAIDTIGNLDSKAFRAPFSQTDQNIYSLLTRSGIIADFSYNDHFNIYENGQFVKYDLKTFNNPSEITLSDKPIISQFLFVNTYPIEDISNTISELKSHNAQFVTSADLTSNPIGRGF